MATIGYGKLLPHTTYANLLVVLETSTGIIGLAMLTGLIFAKFSRPTARVLFSRRAIVTIRDGMPVPDVPHGERARDRNRGGGGARGLSRARSTTLEGESVRRILRPRAVPHTQHASSRSPGR